MAASLLVRGDVMRREAEALWGATSRLLGSESAFVVAYENAKRELHEQEHLNADLRQMLHDKDALIEALRGDLERSRKAAAEPPSTAVDGLHISTSGEVPPVSLRERVIWAGAKDCMVFIEDKRVTFVVDMGLDREGLHDIERRVRKTLPVADDKTYVFRELRP